MQNEGRDSMAAIGIFGGTFNPPHLGHVRAAAAAVQELALDRILIIPTATPPHKPMAVGSASAQDRLEMTHLAFADHPRAQVLDLELRRPGKSYTSQTLRQLAAQYPEATLYLLMGTDMFLSLDSWHEPEVICALSIPVCLCRSTEDVKDRLEEQARALRAAFGCEPVLLNNPVTQLSSTTVRRFLALGAGEDLLPRQVHQYIRSRSLYGTGDCLRSLPFARLQEQALRRYDEVRVPHALGVVQEAEQLAVRWGADPEQARRAAILHDVTKALRGAEQLQLSQAYGIVNTPFDRDHPSLLHAITGAHAAGALFGESPEVCGAVRWHTTGRPGMTKLEKIIYLADMTEPGRSFAGLDEIRLAARQDLNLALTLAMQSSIRDLARRGAEASSLTYEALTALRAERNTT